MMPPRADAYRPKTKAGVYIPTPITVGSQFPNVTPFALTSYASLRKCCGFHIKYDQP
jgi:hypothetical protein